jgi:hypothetical protein
VQVMQDPVLGGRDIRLGEGVFNEPAEPHHRLTDRRARWGGSVRARTSDFGLRHARSVAEQIMTLVANMDSAVRRVLLGGVVAFVELNPGPTLG